MRLCREAEEQIERWLDAVYYGCSEKKAAFSSDYYRRIRKGSSDQSSPEPEIEKEVQAVS